MTIPNSPSSDDTLPPGRVVRWVLLAGVILFSVGLYFRYGLRTPPMGAAPAAGVTTATP